MNSRIEKSLLNNVINDPFVVYKYDDLVFTLLCDVTPSNLVTHDIGTLPVQHEKREKLMSLN